MTHTEEKSISFQECVAHMYENKFKNVPLPLKLTGEPVKFSARDGVKEKTEWYRASINEKGRLIVTYNSHHPDLERAKNYVFNSKGSRKQDKAEIEAQRQRVFEMQRQRTQEEEKREEERKKKAEKSRQRFNNAPEEGSSAYLTRKGVSAHGIKFEQTGKDTVILVPMRDQNGEIQALQEIHETKKLLPGSDKPRDKHFTNAVKGLFHVIGAIENGKPIRVSEGYATAASIFESTTETTPNPVVVAFCADGYDAVIQVLKSKYPQSPIIICADNNVSDDPQKNNKGLNSAKDAVAKYGGFYTYPIFSKNRNKDTEGKYYADFNDLMLVEGKHAVKTQLENNMTPHTNTTENKAPTQIDDSKITSSIKEEIKKLANSILDKEEPCENFNTKKLPKILRDYIDSICKQSEAHPIMITASVLSSLAGILKRRLCIPKGVYYQTLYPNIWTINLYKSGGFKSTAMENGANIARSISRDVMMEMKEISKDLNNKKTKPDEIAEKKLEVSQKDVILPNKITSEAFLEHLGQGHSGVIMTGEFGAWLQNMQNGNNTDLKGIFTELYDVPPIYRYKTKTQGDHILEKPCFSICGVSTLAWLKENLKPNDVQSGFFARFLLFVPPQQDKIPQALPSKHVFSANSEEKKIKETLENMDNQYTYSLSPSATIEFETAHNLLYSMVKSYSDNCQTILDPYLKRWSPSILKIAMIMQLFEDPTSQEISDTAIHASMSILIPAIKSTAHLFEGELGESDHQKKCRLIKEWICKRIKKGNSTNWAALITSKILDGGANMYEYPIKTLVESGQIEEIEREHKKDWFYVPVNKKVENAEKS